MTQNNFITMLLIAVVSSATVTTEVLQSEIKNVDSYLGNPAEVYYQASQSFQGDSNTVRFVTNDVSLLADSIVSFTISIEQAQADEKILLENSNTGVVKFEASTQAAIDANTVTTATEMKVQVIGYGRAVITASLERSPHLKQSFAVYVDDYDFLNYDSIYNASIGSEESFAYLDPMDASDQAHFLVTHQKFYANAVQKATDLAWYEWEAKHESGADFKLVKFGNTDSVQVNFSKGGKYTIYLVESRSADKSVIDSMEFFLNLGADLEGNLETGYLKNYRDMRDGKLYNLTLIEKEISGTTERLFLMDRLQYIPYVVPFGYKETDQLLRNSQNYIFVQGNDSTINPLLLPKDISQDSLVFYNYRAILDIPTTNKEGVVATISNDLSPKKTQGLCPKGFNLPLAKEILGFFYKTIYFVEPAVGTDIELASDDLSKVFFRNGTALDYKDRAFYHLQEGKNFDYTLSVPDRFTYYYLQDGLKLRIQNLTYSNSKFTYNQFFDPNDTNGSDYIYQSFCVKSTLDF